VKYQVKMNNKNYKFKSNKTINELKSSPVLYFLSNGEFKVKECGQVNPLNYLKSHMSNIAKLWVTSNV